MLMDTQNRATIPAADVAKLLRRLASKRPNEIIAVAQMIEAAMRGQEQTIDVKHLGINAGLLGDVLEAAGRGRK